MVRKVFAVLLFVSVFYSPAAGYTQDEIDALDDLMQKLFIERVVSVDEKVLQREFATEEEDEGDEEESPPTMLAELLE